MESVKRLYGEGHTQSEIAEMLGTTQSVVWRFMRNHGIKARVAAKEISEEKRIHLGKARMRSTVLFTSE